MIYQPDFPLVTEDYMAAFAVRVIYYQVKYNYRPKVFFCSLGKGEVINFWVVRDEPLQ